MIYILTKNSDFTFKSSLKSSSTLYHLDQMFLDLTNPERNCTLPTLPYITPELTITNISSLKPILRSLSLFFYTYAIVAGVFNLFIYLQIRPIGNLPYNFKTTIKHLKF